MATETPHFGTTHDGDHPDRQDEWGRLRAKHLRPKSERPASTAQGVVITDTLAALTGAVLAIEQDSS